MHAVLKLVRTTEELRLSVAQFNRDAAVWDYAEKLVRTTTLWVLDPATSIFGPAKFVGFAAVDRSAYDQARAGDYIGDIFDGHATRRAIERALESEFARNETGERKLRAWAESLFGPDIFQGVDASKWRFVVLPGPMEGGKAEQSRRAATLVGLPYRAAQEDRVIAARDPFEVDPDKVDRGTRGHARTQNALAAFLEARGISPRSPRTGEPEYDLAWLVDGTVYVAEVKSTTEANEEKQLRLGLGQVLRYRHLASAHSAEVVAVLVSEHMPSDPSWVDVCRRLGVTLTWPSDFPRLKSLVRADDPATD